MTVYLRHLDEGGDPPVETWFPYETAEEAQAQASSDIARGLQVEGLYEEPDASSTKLLTKAKLK